MAVSDIKVQGGSVAWFVPLIYGSGGNAGKLDSCGTLVSVVCVSDAEIEYPIGVDSGKSEFIQANLAHGVTVEIAKNTKKVDGTGALKTGSSDAAVHKLTINVLESSLTKALQYISLENSANDGYLLACVPTGDTNTAGFGYLLCKINGSIKLKLSGNAANPIQLVLNGIGNGVVEASTNLTHSVINTAITSLTQPGGNALHPSTAGAAFALETGDVALLLTGKWLLKDGN